ncbi:hypothetical protein OIU77_011620 [Salix suchowensis]|uniref:Uncharacterized protein n=1 Tax=Salix suchowensis TaxID=1278906 RepID=A0ABQ9A0W1_9ROSI|nr:hypothetical protein OIU77_011620 [Salix suchowensis]
MPSSVGMFFCWFSFGSQIKSSLKKIFYLYIKDFVVNIVLLPFLYCDLVAIFLR